MPPGSVSRYGRGALLMCCATLATGAATRLDGHGGVYHLTTTTDTQKAAKKIEEAAIAAGVSTRSITIEGVDRRQSLCYFAGVALAMPTWKMGGMLRVGI
eukprot:TRINITY_DN12288_c0_g1_i1.p2 TRINITY_DN12288_c0_g1~~TRINITY_DN12288_c0_g1_i1.p2  ORF type:complete len:100 (+),score=6.90 TRINITY_DN12288_c0_g1_i1:58-357(+)